MRKLLSIITASAMLAAAVPVAFAAEADYEKLIPDVKNRLGIPEEFSEFSYEGAYSRDDEAESYAFRWSKKDEYGNIYVNVSANGDVTYYHNQSINIEEYEYLSADDSTKDKAEEYIKTLIPSLEGDIRLEAEDYQYGAIKYKVYLSRNGIEYAYWIGYISVKSDGTLCMENINPVDLPEEDTSSFISADEAYAQYMENMAPETIYNSYYDEDDKLVIFPVYNISATKVVSAASGGVVELKSHTSALFRNAAASDAVAEETGGMAYKELSESEKQEIARVNEFITDKKAAEIIEERIGIKLDDDIKYHLNVGKKGGYYRFYNYDDDYTAIVVDAKNGDIMSVDFSIDRESKLDEYDFSDPESVKELITYLAPSNADGYEIDPDNWEMFEEQSESEAGARLAYKVNGISVNISAPYAIKSRSYTINIPSLEEYKAAEYASPDTFTGVENAFTASDLQLKYAKTENGIEAVYMPDDYTDINAQTGKRVNSRNMEPVKRAEYTYSDIDEHWIRPAAEKLALAGIGFKGGEFNPEEGISEALAAEVMSQWKYYYDRMKKYDEEALITRRAAADMFVKRLGYEKLVNLDIFKVPYSDTTENYGSIAILKGMGIIASDTEIFRPEDNITRAEFMQMIYNAITAN